MPCIFAALPWWKAHDINVNDDLRLRYRYLDLRRPSMHLANAGQEMTVCGSIARARDKGGIIFADLRDTTGILH